jgi:hypothetical protein
LSTFSGNTPWLVWRLNHTAQNTVDTEHDNFQLRKLQSDMLRMGQYFKTTIVPGAHVE